MLRRRQIRQPRARLRKIESPPMQPRGRGVVRDQLKVRRGDSTPRAQRRRAVFGPLPGLDLRAIGQGQGQPKVGLRGTLRDGLIRPSPKTRRESDGHGGQKGHVPQGPLAHITRLGRIGHHGCHCRWCGHGWINHRQDHGRPSWIIGDRGASGGTPRSAGYGGMGYVGGIEGQTAVGERPGPIETSLRRTIPRVGSASEQEILHGGDAPDFARDP